MRHFAVPKIIYKVAGERLLRQLTGATPGVISNRKQAGAELGQAQNEIGLLGKLILSSSIEVILH